MNYYIADTHLGHENIIKLSNRPFKTIQEMNETIINNWNNRVTNDDDIYILGDLAFKSHHDDTFAFLSKLKGKKHLIVGNHDTTIIKNRDLRNFFVEIKDMQTIVDNGTRIVLCHYPLVEWDGYYRDTLHFYGHIHNNFNNDTTKYISNIPNAYNVGVDIIGFEPKTLEEIIKK